MKAQRKTEFDLDLYERLKRDLSDLDKKEGVTVEAQLQAMMNGRSVEVYEAKLDEINTRRVELRGKIAAQEAHRSQAGVTYEVAEMVAEAIASVKTALESPHLTPVEKNEILVVVVDAVRPNRDGSRFVLSLRPFFVDGGKDTQSRFLIRVTVSSP